MPSYAGYFAPSQRYIGEVNVQWIRLVIQLLNLNH
jgi:hypothetical protein